MRGVRRGNSGSENTNINNNIESNSISLIPTALDNRAEICGVEEISSNIALETFSHKTHFFR